MALGYLVMLGQRLYHNNQRKLSTVNTFAIQNKKTGMDIRPFNAGIGDEVKIIQYKHHNWECMTWQFIKLEDGSYLLKNLYTHKTFQSSSALESGVTLWQQPLEANKFQYWEFLRQSEDEYLIRLKDSELYVTVSDDKNNSSIILMPMQNKLEQHWKLIEQHPTM
ncbi:RICIN domain-containing protein [Anaerosporobacter sp.]|uniref:RICIN domain-containing protein n=1 Tax=Anaerosporobacter sp. TaxID=1872529 RepID=UPI00286F1670|nr:RICIN domain-containing protein [Anaerosporobacter sp.]